MNYINIVDQIVDTRKKIMHAPFVLVLRSFDFLKDVKSLFCHKLHRIWHSNPPSSYTHLSELHMRIATQQQRIAFSNHVSQP
jgi:hypothetical protein